MKSILFAALLAVVTVATVAIASGKYESSSDDASSVVLYGQGPSGIVAFKVDVNGVLQMK